MRPSDIAAKYVGQKELPGNVWADQGLGKSLHGAGQKDGEPYCAYFTEVVFKEYFDFMFPPVELVKAKGTVIEHSKKWKEMDTLFSASAVQTFKNFEKAAYVTGILPAIDWLVIWRSYKDGLPLQTGHAGVVCSINENDKYLFSSVEANTTDGTKENREGGVVAIKPHRASPDVQNGLRVLGFVKII